MKVSHYSRIRLLGTVLIFFALFIALIVWFFNVLGDGKPDNLGKRENSYVIVQNNGTYSLLVRTPAGVENGYLLKEDQDLSAYANKTLYVEGRYVLVPRRQFRVQIDHIEVVED